MVIDRREALNKVLHDLPEGWEWEWFTDVMDIEGGTQPPASEFVDESRPGYIRLVQIRDFESNSHITYIPDSPKWRKCRASDVLIARYGASLGRICTGLEGAYNVALAKVVPTERVHLPFAHHLLRSTYFQDPLLASGARSAQAGFNKDGLSVISLPIPPIQEQRAIAHILGTLNDKIELNRRMNKTLESIARVLFKSWFVDFDPVHTKVEGHEPDLPKFFADLFPDSWEDSELGKIPKGWGVGCFSDVVEQMRQQENPLSSPDVLFSHYSIPAFDEGQWPKTELGESIKSVKFRVPPGTMLLSKLNPEIERVWLVDVRHGARAVCSTEFLVLCPRAPYTRCYAYCLARSPLFRPQIEALVTGTSKSHQRAHADTVLGLLAIRPPALCIKAFEECVSSLLDRTLACRREARTITILRDTLLPKLITGELWVKDVENVIKRAVP